MSVPSIAGFTTVCTGATSNLTVPDGPGIWISSNASVATIGSSSGIVSGLTVGTTIITFIPVLGCTATAVITVITSPAGITGATSVCAGQNITLSNAMHGGVWSCSAPTIATINPTNGLVNGMAGPLGSTIYYSFGGSCTASYTITVNALSPITGSVPTVCQGQTTTLYNAISGGTWLSSAPGVSMVGPGTGLVTGISAGEVTISYALSNGCIATYEVTVNALNPITGPAVLCVGQQAILGNAISGGIYSSQTPTIASISPTGIVNGNAGGLSTIISYTLASGCITTKTIYVNPLANIEGFSSVCVGQSILLTDAVSGGVWRSSDTTIAIVTSLYGNVSGVSAGGVNITYTLPTGCNSVMAMVVNPLSPITGMASVCNGLSITLSNAIPGGIWTSSSPSMAIVGPTSGIVTGVAAGFTPIITYTLGTGCKSTKLVTVNALSAISGGLSICQSQPIILTNPNISGTWSCADLSIATIGSTGIITGITSGTTTISYVLPTGCMATRTERVNASPIPNGQSSICIAKNTTLTNAEAPGIWTSNNTPVATIGSYSGVVSGLTIGTAVITYKILSSGCRTTYMVKVGSAPTTITGSDTICAGTTTTFSNLTPFGFWSSNNTTIATIDSLTGVISGIGNGISVITYSTGCGCNVFVTKVLTIANSPITGSMALCVGGTTTLLNTSPGGTWSSSNSFVATIGLGSGLVTALTRGTSIINYVNGLCSASAVLVISDVPSLIYGTPSLCTGSSISLTDTMPNGIWSSNDTAVVTIGDHSGVLTGIALGVATITYSTGCGIAATITATVSPPSPIMGVASICVGETAMLSNTGGGTWSSSNASVAFINATSGLVVGITSGTTTISYIFSIGCIATAIETINPAPLPITGGSSVCVSSAITLTNATSGGSWASSSPGSAAIGSVTGIVTGVSTGTTIISYIIGTGCATSSIITVNTLPAAISGPMSVCLGDSATLSDSGGGTWNSSNLIIASIGITTGMFFGLTAGTSIITYSLATGCSITNTITVNPPPTAISGLGNVCFGSNTTYTDGGGGTWSSSDIGTATIGSASGILTGVGIGTIIITYSLTTGCIAIVQVTVNILPGAVTGTLQICPSATTTLTSSGDGIWSSSNTSVATAAPYTGIITGLISGTSIITYSSGIGCNTTAIITVSPMPDPITGTAMLCMGATTTLGSAVGGIWSSNNSSLAIVGSTSGIVTGISSGAAIISYANIYGCSVTKFLSVNATPADIEGNANIIIGGSSALTNATTGGTWTSSNLSVATIGSLTGLLTGLSGGTSIITYTLPTGCMITTLVSVNPVMPITGLTDICIGFTRLMADATTGGNWTSSNTAVATISSTTGLVSTISTGTSIISYIIPSVGFRTVVIKVHDVPL